MAKKPNSNQSNTLGTQPADATTKPCELNHIPLFPLRYALTGDAIEKATKGTSCGKPPASLSAVDNVTFELTRIRGGYVNIFVESGIGKGSDKENLWHVFYHCTAIDDDNSSMPRIDTDKKRSGTAHYFYKYEWDKGVDGHWSILTEKGGPAEKVQTYPYPFVAVGTSTAWVAYSEERWPAHYYKKAQSDEAFRKKMMTKVEISEEPATAEKYAPLVDLPKFARSFDPEKTSKASFNFSNSIRHTQIVVQSWTFVANSLCAQKHGYIVLIDDPVAMTLDLGAMFTLTQQSKALLAQEYAYPLTTGEIVAGLEKAEAIRTNTSSFLSIGGERPHTNEFTAQYQNILSEYKSALNQLNLVELSLFKVWQELVNQSGAGTIHSRLMLHSNEFGSAETADQSEIAGYGLFDTARTVGPLASCENEKINVYFDAIIYGASNGSGAGAIAMADLIAKYGGAFGSVFTSAADRDFFYVASWDLAIETFAARLNRRKGNYSFSGGKLANTSSSQVITFSSKAGAEAAIEEMFQDGHYPGPFKGPLADADSSNVDTITSEPRYPHARPQVTYSIKCRKVVMAEAPPRAWFERAKALASSWDKVPGAGFALFTSSLALSDAVREWNEAKEYSEVREWLFHPAIVTIAAFTDVVSQVLSLPGAVQGLSQSSAVASRIFNGMPALRNVAVAQPASRLGRGAQFVMRGLTARATGVVIGLYMSSKDLSEGWDKNDKNLKISGGLGIASVAGFLSLSAISGPPGWFVLAASSLAAIGSIIYGVGKLNDHELWVRDGFWGTEEEWLYWGGARPRLNKQIEDAKALAHPDHPNHTKIAAAYDKELKDFFEKTMGLAITDETENDQAINIRCQGIQTPFDMKRLNLDLAIESVWEARQGERFQEAFRKIPLTYPGDYRIEYKSVGQVTVIIDDNVFREYRPAGQYTADLLVNARFIRKKGELLSEREKINYITL